MTASLDDERLGELDALLDDTGADEAAPRSSDEMMADAEALDENAEPPTISRLVGETGALDPITRRKVWDVIKAKTKMPLAVMKESLEADRGSRGKDDLGLAREVINEIGADNVLAAQSFIWCWHSTGVWRKCEPRTVRQWVQTTLSNSEDVEKSLVDSVTDLFTTEVFKPRHQFDTGADDVVNCLNGELMTSAFGLALMPHDRENYRTTQIPVKYDEGATAPRFERFLEEIFPGDPKQKAALLEMMGYSLMPHCRHERFIILIGSGANGKSVLLRVLEALVGVGSVAGVQPAQFANKFQRAHLHNKLVNIVTEIEQGAVIDDAALKGIVSGEPTTVEHKFKDPFQMTPFATCWFGTNHMPHTRDFSDALFRRALILQFEQAFKPELGNCDPQLADKLIAELPGILNMALAAYVKATQQGFTMPERSQRAREEWRLEADQVAQFVQDECTAGGQYEVKASELYSHYRQWAMDNGISRSLSMKSFRDRLTRLGFGNRRMRDGRYVTGVTHTGGAHTSGYFERAYKKS